MATTWLATGDFPCLFDARSGIIVRQFGVKSKFGTKFSFLTFSPDSKTLFTTNNDDGLQSWDIASGKELRRIPIPGGYTRWSADRKVVLCNGFYQDKGHRASLWDMESGKEIRSWAKPGNEKTYCLAPDGKTIAVLAYTYLALCDATDGKELRRCEKRNAHGRGDGGDAVDGLFRRRQDDCRR